MANRTGSDGLVFGGRMFTASEMAVICEVAASCGGLSRKNWPTRSASCWAGGASMVR